MDGLDGQRKSPFEFRAQEHEGSAIPSTELKEMQLFLDGEKFVVEHPNKSLGGGFMKWDRTKRAGEMDLRITEGKAMGLT